MIIFPLTRGNLAEHCGYSKFSFAFQMAAPLIFYFVGKSTLPFIKKDGSCSAIRAGMLSQAHLIDDPLERCPRHCHVNHKVWIYLGLSHKAQTNDFWMWTNEMKLDASNVSKHDSEWGEWNEGALKPKRMLDRDHTSKSSEKLIASSFGSLQFKVVAAVLRHGSLTNE